MSHYAIVKRNVYIENPNWKSNLITDEKNVIKYQYLYSDDYLHYENVIYLDCKIKENIIFWKGEINQEILKKGEYLIIGDDCFEIERVEKSTDGSVVYYIQNYYEKSIYYKELLKTANLKYDNFIISEKLKKEKELINKYTETLNKNTKLNKFEKLLKYLKIKK